MIRVAIIGAGRGGTSLLKLFNHDPLVRIVGVVDINHKAPGITLAHHLDVPTFSDYKKLLKTRKIDLVIDVTGSKEVEEELLQLRRNIAVIGGSSAKFMWQLIEERIKGKEELFDKGMKQAISEERTRIALDIHDGLLQMLAGLTYKLDLCEDLLSADPVLCREGLRETKSLLKTAIEEARQVVFSLRPYYFDKLPLTGTIKNYLKTYSRQYRIETIFHPKGYERKLLPNTKMFLFRIIQEALSNVQRHANAKKVEVRLEMTDGQLTASVADDGIGFDYEKTMKKPERWGAFGLKGMIKRSQLIGGSLRVESTIGKGTTVIVQIPLKETEKDL